MRRQRAVRGDAGAHGVADPHAREQACGVRDVDPTAGQAVGLCRVDQVLVGPDLLARVGIESAVRTGDVGHDALDLHVLRITNLTQKIQCERGRDPQAAHARVDVQVNASDEPERRRQLGQVLASVGRVQADVDAVLETGPDLGIDDRSEHQDRQVQARGPQFEGFRGRADPEGAHATAHRVAGDRDRPVSISIGLDDQHDAHARAGPLPNDSEVGRQCVEVDLGPSSGVRAMRVHVLEDTSLGRRFNGPGDPTWNPLEGASGGNRIQVRDACSLTSRIPVGRMAPASRLSVPTGRHQKKIPLQGGEGNTTMAKKKAAKKKATKKKATKKAGKKKATGDLIISKARTKAAAGLNVSGEFYGALDEAVRALIAGAEARADSNGRRTLRPYDL